MNRGNWVRSMGLSEDGSLFVEIDTGNTLYDSCRDTFLSTPRIVYPQDLMRIENRNLYHSFASTLNEISAIMYGSAYDGSYEFRKGDVVVDAGARIGTFSAKASLAVGDEGKVIAIEPEPHNYDYLLKNIEVNKWKNVVAVRKMLWSKKRELNLHLSGYNAAHSAYRNEFYNCMGGSIAVEADTLDSILDALGIGAVDFIKMDIEGSEIEALKGMNKTLLSDVQMAIAAYHPIGSRLTHRVIIPRLERLGFKVTYTEDGIVQARR